MTLAPPRNGTSAAGRQGSPLSEIGEVAVAAHDRGWAVIPVTKDQKEPPLVPWRQFQSESPSRVQVAEWWTNHPDANPAVITGRVSNLTVIDLDGKAGTDSFTKHLKDHLPRTRVHATPNGYHLLYQFTPELRTGVGLLPGVDIRNEGGYVIAPPSVVNGKPYIVAQDRPIALLKHIPDALRGLAHQTKTEVTQDTGGSGKAWTLLNAAIPSGTRNDTLTRIAGWLKRYHSTPVVESLLLAINDGRCNPPLPEHEVRSIAQSIGRYPAASLPTGGKPHFRPVPKITWIGAR